MRADLCLAALLCCGCSFVSPAPELAQARSEPIVIEPLVTDLRAHLREEDREEEVVEVEADAGTPAAAISVADAVRVPRPAAYRNPRYIARCRREARGNAPEAETMESKPDARARARGLARAGSLDVLLLLSRIAYGETGTPRPNVNDNPATPTWDEVEAFLAVLDGRRGGMSRAEMFVSYSPRRVFDGARPPSWPRPRQRRFHGYPGWRNYGCPRWLATVDAVRRVLEAHPRRVTTGPCERRPDHWGGAVGIDEHAVRLGWHLVDCGSTRNRFWVIPEHIEDETLPAPAPVLEQAADDDPPNELREAALPAPQGVLG
jgi:hypothetical protein